MIKLKELRQTNLPAYRFGNESGMDAKRAQNAILHFLESANETFGLPVSFSCDEVKSGGLLGGNCDPCILIKHKEHPYDYFQYCLIIKMQGRVVLLQTWYYGNSALAAKAAKGKMSGLGGAIKNAAFGTKDRWQEECEYYEALDAMIAVAAK